MAGRRPRRTPKDPTAAPPDHPVIVPTIKRYGLNYVLVGEDPVVRPSREEIAAAHGEAVQAFHQRWEVNLQRTYARERLAARQARAATGRANRKGRFGFFRRVVTAAYRLADERRPGRAGPPGWQQVRRIFSDASASAELKRRLELSEQVDFRDDPAEERVWYGDRWITYERIRKLVSELRRPPAP
jgi:hypothetical protein